jgi:hypothetical protein
MAFVSLGSSSSQILDQESLWEGSTAQLEVPQWLRAPPKGALGRLGNVSLFRRS